MNSSIEPSPIRLRYCYLISRDYGIDTVFPDNTKSSNFLPANIEFTHLSHACGFLDPMKYLRDHDLSHAYLSEVMFNKPSPVLWNAAHQIELHGEGGLFEERTIYHWQRFVMNIGSVQEPEWKEWAKHYKPLAAKLLAEW